MKIKKYKHGQEEIMGFALIVILVAVILFVFLGIYLSSPKKSIESYEVGNFIQASLQYTSDCEDDFGYLSVQELIFNCNDGKICMDSRSACDVLNSTLEGMLKTSWSADIVKGYELKIVSNNEEMLMIKQGNVTNNYKGSMQDFARSGDLIEVFMSVYY